MNVTLNFRIPEVPNEYKSNELAAGHYEQSFMMAQEKGLTDDECHKSGCFAADNILNKPKEEERRIPRESYSF